MRITDILDINAEAERVHIANENWWVDINTGKRIERDKGMQCMLIISEISEAVEGARKDLMDDHLPQYKQEHVEIIDTFIRLLDFRHGHGCREPFVAHDYEDAGPSVYSYGGTLYVMTKNVHYMYDMRSDEINWLACDWVINTLYFYACWRGFANQFVEIYNAKMAYNATREDHSLEHRRSANGKKE